jgi:hypothetical protein
MAQAGLSPLEPGFDLRPVSMELVMHKVVMGYVSCKYFSFPLSS